MAGGTINLKPQDFESFLKLVAQARETLTLNATPESTKVAVDLVLKGIDSGFLTDAEAGTAAITPHDTGLAPNKYLATGPMAPNKSQDPGLMPVDAQLADKKAVDYDDATKEDMKAKQDKSDEESEAKRKGKNK